MKSSSILFSIIIIIFLIVEHSTICCLAKNNATFYCVPREKKALLRFKASLFDPSNRLASWKTNYDECCSWAGVECDKASGHVIGLHLGNTVTKNAYSEFSFIDFLSSLDSMLRSETLDSSLLELKYLRYLDLSWNDFLGSSVPASLGSIKQLQHLNLSNANFSGVVPCQLGNLSSLRALDLGSSDFYYYHEDQFYNYLIVNDLSWAMNLSSLEYLYMRNVNLSTTNDLVKVLGTLTSLVELRLSESELDNTNLPHTNCLNSTLFTNVQYLDLSGNSFEGSFPCFLQNMTSLSFLDLSSNGYNSSGNQPFPRLMNLSYLDLSLNSLNHNTDWISDNFLSDNCCRLKSLNLDGNQFYGDISGAFRNLSRCSSHNLESLDLGYNKFYGRLPEELGELKQLTMLDVSGNNLSGPIPSSLVYLRALTMLGLSFNQLSGEIPIFLGQMSNLERIYIYDNAFEGTLSEAHFANLSKLEILNVDSNYMLQFRVRYEWAPPFQLKYLEMGSINIEGPFPQWLRTQKALIDLDLSNCSITGTLPKWLESLVNLTALHLSDNHIEGLPSDIGHMMPSLSDLRVSGNLINASIPDSLCEMKNLRYLDLSKNHLSGNLPDCWGNFSTLILAKLSSNQLSGVIPNSIGGAHWLRRLHLGNNSLTGQLPSNLKNCTLLQVLDVGDNNLSGELPEWIGTDLLGLIALRLRNNNFHGDIPSVYCQLSKSQIMDLADNNLTGNIPRCFGNFSGMVDHRTTPSYAPTIESFSEMVTGAMREYEGMTLMYLVHLDLSNNHLVGEIPSELTILTGLLGLNLSHNHLRGRIPGNVGDMKSLVSLDLSSNNLSGNIPGSLSNLTFLSHLNLSSNNLSGKIPTGTQLQTFNDPSDYAGNLELCGDPLPKKCQVNNETPPKVEHDADDDDGVITYKIYLYASIFGGIATGFWGFFGVLVFKRSWRLALFRYMDPLIGRMMGLY